MRYEEIAPGLNISAVGMGCWAIGGRQWGAVDDNQSIEAIKAARAKGVNFFDTADFYGFGHSEELLGRTIGGDPEAVIATKVGLRWNKKGKIRHDLSAAYIRQACEASLKRLNRETIDIYQIHWPDPGVSLDEILGALESLVQEGKVRYVGACNMPLDDIKKLMGYSWFVSYQGLFHLFDQEVREEIIPFCRDHDLKFIAYEPLAKGLLTGKFTEAPTFGLGDHRKYDNRFGLEFRDLRRKVEQVKAEAEKYNITVAQLSLALLLYYGATSVIPGAKSASQVAENVEALQIDRDVLERVEPSVAKYRLLKGVSD
ncbi:MAG: aldo/keto reductase [Actinomycetia bacterium]|nr:aldo/keto reductase [Actinomycetes bacterium]